jgi:hypothetical protein
MNEDVWTNVADLKRGQLVEVGTRVWRVARRTTHRGRAAVVVFRDMPRERMILAPYDGRVRIQPRAEDLGQPVEGERSSAH